MKGWVTLYDDQELYKQHRIMECLFIPFEHFPIRHLYGTGPEYLLESRHVWNAYFSIYGKRFTIHHLYGTLPEYPLESQRVSGKYHLTENLLKGWVTLYD